MGSEKFSARSNEKKAIDSAIKELQDKFLISEDQVRPLYEHYLHEISQNAKIRDFIPIFVYRHTQQELKKRYT